MCSSSKSALGCLGSVVAGFLLMIPLAMLFDAMDWPLFHTWGLAHGSFILAWPLLALLSFGGFRIAARLKNLS